MGREITTTGVSSQQVLLDLSVVVPYRPQMALGKRLKEARLARKLTQEKLVTLVPGSSQAALSALEKRDSETTTLLFAFADALEVSPRWLLTGEEPSGLDSPIAKRQDALTQKIMAALPGLSKDSRQRLVHYAEALHTEDSRERTTDRRTPGRATLNETNR